MRKTNERCILGKSYRTAEKEHLDRYNFALNYVENKKVLDIACGSGYGSAMLSLKAKRVIGVDISKKAVRYAKDNFNKKNITFLTGDATDLDFIKGNSIDIVVSFETIEHLENYKGFLIEIKRILKKNGLLIISTPNKKYFSPNSNVPQNKYHKREFFLEEFRSLLSVHFKEVCIYGQDYQSVYKLIKQKIINMIPRRIRRKIISKKISELYHLSQIDGFVKSKANNSRFIIAIYTK